ncbi:TPA: hypothetical protein ACRZ4F_002688 [Vibrio harveyi]
MEMIVLAVFGLAFYFSRKGLKNKESDWLSKAVCWYGVIVSPVVFVAFFFGGGMLAAIS